MTPISSGSLSPIFTSASMPRSLKIPTARGLRLSAIRTLVISTLAQIAVTGWRRWGLGGGDEFAAHALVGPIEPREKRFQIRALDRGSRPNPQAGRRISIGVYVEGNTLVFEDTGELLRKRRSRVDRELSHPRIGECEADRCAGTRLGVFRQEI